MTSIEITIIIVLLIFVIFLIEFIGLYLLIRFILLKYLYTNEKKLLSVKIILNDMAEIAIKNIERKI